MRRLKNQNKDITVDNIMLFASNPDEDMNAFKKKHFTGELTVDDINVNFFPDAIGYGEDMFEEAHKCLIGNAFARLVEDSVSEINYYNSYNDENYHSNILDKAQLIIKAHETMYSNGKSSRDYLAEAQKLVNSQDEYISTSSRVLNSYIGGFTRRYVTPIIAKASHCKSGWVDFNIAQGIKSGKIKKKVVKITPEENADVQMKRYIAMFAQESTTGMRQKLITITAEHLQKVRDIISDKIIIYDNVYKERMILDIMRSCKDVDMIVVDHITTIEFPGNRTWLDNQIGGTPGFVIQAEKIAKEKNCVMMLLSQVNDKEIMRSDRINKAPRYWDAYGSSSLYQKSREFLALYYPLKDWEENAFGFTEIPSINDVRLRIEKSSFTKLGSVKLNYIPEYNIFLDVDPDKKLAKSDYIPPEEKGLFE